MPPPRPAERPRPGRGTPRSGPPRNIPIRTAGPPAAPGAAHGLRPFAAATAPTLRPAPPHCPTEVFPHWGLTEDRARHSLWQRCHTGSRDTVAGPDRASVVFDGTSHLCQINRVRRALPRAVPSSPRAPPCWRASAWVGCSPRRPPPQPPPPLPRVPPPAAPPPASWRGTVPSQPPRRPTPPPSAPSSSTASPPPASRAAAGAPRTATRSGSPSTCSRSARSRRCGSSSRRRLDDPVFTPPTEGNPPDGTTGQGGPVQLRAGVRVGDLARPRGAGARRTARRRAPAGW